MNDFYYLYIQQDKTTVNQQSMQAEDLSPKLIDMAASIPKMYGYVPTKVELYKTEDEKKQAGRKTFDSGDFKGIDVITVDEWLQICMKHIIAKAATLAAYPILVQRSRVEFKAFANTNAITDTNEDHLFSRGSFSKLGDTAASILRMYRYVPTDADLYKTEDEKDQARRKTFNSTDLKGPDVITKSDVSRDVSPLDDALDYHQGTLPQHEDHHDGSRDVSPPDDADNGHQGTLSQQEDKDLHGAKERGQEEKVVTQ